jgi:hypothetical protein
MRNTMLYRALTLALACLLWVGWAWADPPARVARLGYVEGDVSLSPAGQSDWVQAGINRPLTTGDHLWTDSNARAELQLGGTAIHLGARSNLTLLNLNDSIAQLQLSEGSLRLRVRSIGARQSVEVDTPNLALVLTQAGDYRLDVAADGSATSVRVQSGVAETYGEGTSYRISAGQTFRFYGTGLAELEALADPLDDALDRWAAQREHRLVASIAARYVSADVVGYEDLDANGSWRTDESYGSVWIPARVANGWTPYRDGHWAWVEPWGWTWVDDAPWGYAVSHYGRWARIHDAWCWVPGPRHEAAVYAPALVVFLGGSHLRDGALGASGHVGWFPLAPREVYQPAYPVSRGYFDRVNRSNAVIAASTLSTTYSNPIKDGDFIHVPKFTYANQQVAGAVVAVPALTFVQSRPVAQAVVPVAKDLLQSAAPPAQAVLAAPALSSRGGAPDAHSRPPQERHGVVARTAPPAASTVPATPAIPAATGPRVHLLTPSTAATPPIVPPAVIDAGKLPAPRAPEAARGEVPPPTSVVKVEQRKPEATGVPAATPPARAEQRAPDPARSQVVRPAPPKAAQLRVPPGPSDATNKEQALKAEAARAEAAKADAARAEAAKANAEKAAAAGAESARLEASRQAAQQVEAAKAQADRAEAAQARADAARVEAAKAEAGRAAAARAEASHNAAAKEQASKAQQAQRDNTLRSVPATPPAAAPSKSDNPANASRGKVRAGKSERELQLEEDARRAIEAGKTQ